MKKIPKGWRRNKFDAIEPIPRKFYVERDGIGFTVNQGTFYLHMTADEHLRLISDLQEALLRRSMYDGFMRRHSNGKP